MRLLAIQHILDSDVGRLIPKGATLAEIGPGLGDGASFLSHQLQAEKYYLIEIAEQAQQALKTRFGEQDKFALLQDMRLLPEPVDGLFLFEVAEHIENDQAFFDDAFQAIKPEGAILGSVPAFQSKWQKVDEAAGHVRRYEREALQSKLAAAGFQNIQIVGYGFPITNLLYPIRQLYYSRKKIAVTSKEKSEATQKSGTDRKAVEWINSKLVVAGLKPFSRLQTLRLLEKLSDGFIFFAQRP